MGCFRDIEQDLRYAIRMLRRSPGFAAVAMLTLALGIGATTAIYSIVDTILVQPLPFDDADRLVRVVENVPSFFVGRPPVQRGVPYPDFLEWRARATTLTDVFAITESGRLVRTPDGTARLWGGMTSSDAFVKLGAHLFSDERSVWMTMFIRMWSCSASTRGDTCSAATPASWERHSSFARTGTEAVRRSSSGDY